MASEKGKGKEEAQKFPASFRPEEIVLYPYTTEKAVRMTAANIMTFIVARRATKNTVKMAVEALYGVKVKAVRSENAADGRKKAFVALDPAYSASELASRLGML